MFICKQVRNIITWKSFGFLATYFVGALTNSVAIWCNLVPLIKILGSRSSRACVWNLLSVVSVAEPTGILCEGNLSNVPNIRRDRHDLFTLY
jgi:hypothetical protein